MFNSTKWIIWGFVALAIIAIVGAGAWHYNKMVEDAKTLRANNAVLEVSLKTQADTIDQMQKAIVGWKKAQEDLISTMKVVNAAARKARDEAKKTDEIFARHDLALLALSKPALVQARINRATGQALLGLECASSERGCAP